ncbi:TOMM precursor leader peptide-binding protein [Streptomyces sp. AA0539]|uniref:TOMM precursor leader peptide-binding protein n=1 Tax=Streptomyces sp. AA0539 TaxID=1210045 RepID=UPI0002FD9E87|nr:TOMM precursor leader peptide-binding protein [Streptomyces sp. AA0539]
MLVTTATPLEAARAQLADALDTTVVTLGATDALQCAAPDPYAGRRPAATVHLSSRAVLLGPWGATADGTGCGQCLAMRWQRLRTRSEREALELGFDPAGATGWPVLTDHALDAIRATRAALTGRTLPPGEPARVTRLDLATLALATFPLLPEPLCPHCVHPAPGTAEAARMRLTPSPRTAGHRTRPLDSYRLPETALANPVCGALGSRTELNPVSTTTAPVSGSHFVRGYAGLNDVTWSGQATRYDTSRRLAHLEGLERYAGTHARRGTAPVRASYHRLLRTEGAAAVLDPAACGFYPAETYRSDPLLSPFDPDRELPWLWGYSLRAERPVLVPARLAHYGAGERSDNFVFECSNGCATGGTLTEAVLFGLLELIERDAFLVAWYGRRPPVRLDLGTCRDPAIRTALDRAALLGYDVHAFDTRADLPVPVVTGVAVRRDGGLGHLSFGAAAGLDAEAAVDGALSEVLTYIPHLPYQVGERLPELRAMAEDYDRVEHLKDHAQLYGLPEMARHAAHFLAPSPATAVHAAFADWEAARPRTGDLLDDLHTVRDALTAAGHDVIAVDQTTPEQAAIGLHTVATLVPGLLPLDFGHRRQRAPLLPRLHRLAGTTGLNPAPHPFP